MSKNTMECGLCKTEVQPLDAHMGRLNGQQMVFHIECWNKHLTARRPFEGELLKQIKEYYRIGLTWSSNALESFKYKTIANKDGRQVIVLQLNSADISGNTGSLVYIVSLALAKNNTKWYTEKVTDTLEMQRVDGVWKVNVDNFNYAS